MKWLVAWIVISTVPAECPDFKPDPYTGQLPSMHCAVYHCKEVKRLETKTFESRKEADDFIEAAPKDIKNRMSLVALKQPESD